MKKEKKIIIIKILVAIAIALVSFFYLGDKLSNPETYDNIISVLDEKKSNVMGLTASTSAASIAITTLPNDIGTPIANQLADLTSYLLIILTIVYLEKYLLTVIGFGVFKVIIPIAAITYVFATIWPSNISIKKVSAKLTIFGIAMMLLIPTSVIISKMIDDTYQDSINETLEVTNQGIEIEESQTTEETSAPELKWYEKIYNTFSNVVEDVKETVTTSTSEAVNKVKTVLSNFIEATAVMIVTSCLIPLITVAVFIWLSKTILSIDFYTPNLLETKNNIKNVIHNDKPQDTRKLESKNFGE